jgi:putative hemolysin
MISEIKMKKILFQYTRYLLIIGLILSACIPIKETERAPIRTAPDVPTPTVSDIIPPATQAGEEAGLPNPASEFCESNGGKLEIRTDKTGGQSGICIFPDGSECDEWAYFRGECQPGASNQGQGPLPPPRYVNEKYDFTLDPTIEWEIQPSENQVIFVNQGFYLFLGFKWEGEEVGPFRTGMPEGDFVDAGTYILLGQLVPRQYLTFEGRTKLVYYAWGLQVGNLRLYGWLDTRQGDYKSIDIPPEMITKGDDLLATFTLTSGETSTINVP